MSRIRVLIADDHAIMRAGLRLLLEAEDDMEVVAEAGTAAECVARGLESEPDVILLDISMPGASGLEAIERLREAGSVSRVLVLTMHDEVAYVRAGLGAGAAGYVTKDASASEILAAIRALRRGRSYIAVPILDSGAALDDASPEPEERADPGLSELSAREREVLRLAAEGHTNREAAARLHLSVKTVESYRARIAAKLGLQRRADLVRYALETGLLLKRDDDTS